MTYAEQLRSDYAAVRARLLNPPTAVKDTAAPPVCRDIRVNPKEDVEKSRPRKMKNPLNQRWVGIANEVAEKHGVSVRGILSASRSRPLPEARSELYYRMRHSGMTFPEISRLLKKDQSTCSVGAAKFARNSGL